MSVLWERRVGGTHYEVRQAGASLRLYSNGVFHSQYNPNRVVTRSVWDLLLIPAFFYPAGQLERILVLGVGGGAVIQQLRHFCAPEHIVGVDLSAIHLSIARRFFGVRGEDVELVRADAVDWVGNYRGPAFDMIIDDLFTEVGGEPQRAVCADDHWVKALSACLAPQGMIVSNFASRLELDVSAWLYRGRRSGFAAGFCLTTAQNYNAVGVFTRRTVTTRQLRERLKRERRLDPRKAGGLRYRIRSLAL